jgi:hypothetical protein
MRVTMPRTTKEQESWTRSRVQARRRGSALAAMECHGQTRRGHIELAGDAKAGKDRRVSTPVAKLLACLLCSGSILAAAEGAVRVCRAADDEQRATVPSISAGQIDAALADRVTARPGTIAFAPPEPKRLRPCCAFGFELEVKLGAVPVPAFALKTVRDRADLGAHEFGAGLVQVTPSPAADAIEKTRDASSDRPAREHNGIVYTCRGGFIDTAHLRDYADLTTYLASRLGPILETGGTIELADQGGARRVRVSPVAASDIARTGRTPLAVRMAAWLTFELSVWREIATWYGHESVPPWPEKISSFSLEDLYSNLLGTKLATAVLLGGPVANEVEYDLAMTAWIDAALRELGTVPSSSAAAAMRLVDGSWWDSTRKVPDWQVQRGRKFDMGPVVEPWLVTMASRPSVKHVAGGEEIPERAGVGCAADASPVGLAHTDRIDGLLFADAATVEIVVSDRLVEHGLTLPSPATRIITQRDFRAIGEKIRDEIDAVLGGHCDRP